MADIAVAAVITKAIDIAANLLVEECSHLYWLREDIDWIQREMRSIQSYLADVDAKQDGNQVITNFINDIRDLAYDTEDIMDAYSPLMNMRNRKGFMGFLRTAICIFYDCYIAHCLAMEIKKIKRRVDDINRDKNSIVIMESSFDNSSTRDTWVSRKNFSHIDEPNIVGFEEHIENLKAKLLDTNLQHFVISIVGMPGLGKTTLARKVYKSIKSDFECSAWICVSQDPIVKNLLQDVARQVGLGKEEWEQNVEVNLYEFLRRKRYVIIVDDLWDQKAWDALKVGIPTTFENGSRIIITSRHDYVGLYIGGDSSLHRLLPLNKEDSWKLFSKLVTSNIQSTQVTSFSTELEALGRQILERCGGVPLAIVVIAGLLVSRNKTVFQWRAVLDSIGQKEDECSKILALSYNDLPTELKPCFLYFGIFPQDREISAFQLINMWVAERFVEASGVQLLEDVGEDYLNQLIARNLIQEVRRRHDGRIKSCCIHDLLHNLCIFEAVKSNFFNTRDNVSHNFGTRVRRVSFQRSSISEYISLKNTTPKLRALLCFNEYELLGMNQLKSFLGDFRFLRVLTVECMCLGHLPNEIGSLSFLSYFEIKGEDYGYVELPSTMGNLKNLLTLKVRYYELRYFPTFIWKMKQLRHVLLPFSGEAPTVRRSCGLRSHKIEVSLPNLQTLDHVHSACMEPNWLRKLTNIRKLGIVDPTEQAIKVLSDATPISEKLEDLRLLGYGRPHNTSSVSLMFDLSGYQNLHKLHLRGVVGMLPNADKLPQNLTKLILKNCCLEEDPLEKLKNLSKLKFLKLGFWSYKGEKMMCYGGANAFPQLQVLAIHYLLNLQELFVEEGGMPTLIELQVCGCESLTKIPNQLRDIMICS